MEWVSLAKEIHVCATDVVELEFWRSSYHLRNSLKIVGRPDVSDKVRSMVDGGTRVVWTTVVVEEDAVPQKKLQREKNPKTTNGSDQDDEDKSRTLTGWWSQRPWTLPEKTPNAQPRSAAAMIVTGTKTAREGALLLRLPRF